MATNEGDIDGEEVNSFNEVHGEEGKEDEDFFRKIRDMTDDEVRDLEFETLEKATDFYDVYAKCHGFAMRKDDVERDPNGDIVARQLVCNREGKNNAKRAEKAKERRATTRTGCRARFRVSHNFVADRWRVSKFESSHNHELTATQYVHMIPKYRRLSEYDKSLIDGLHTHGVRTCHILGFMLAQKGGYTGLGFCKKDLYNYINGRGRERIEDGDAFAALSYLQAKADNDPMFFCMFTTTNKVCLENLFWSDSASRADYECFGDVIAFDATYKKNRYNKPLVIICGYNHHGETTIFGFALVSHETIETYKWVLNSFLEAMSYKHPKAVVTDGALAMKDAIRDVFPDSMHRLCSWHLHRNACENVKMPKFLEEFKTLVYANYTPEKFETEWKRVVDDNGLSNNEWVKKVYKMKTMWASAYMRDKFFCGIRTTSLCEAVNSFIKMYVQNKNSLVDFLHKIERAVKEYRHNELKSDFNTFYYEPVLKTKLEGIEIGASKIFTRNKFAEVQRAIEDASTLNVIDRHVLDNIVTLKMNKFCNKDSTYLVRLDTVENKFLCDCRHFERVGIPCSHIICAMKNEHVNVFPDSLICKRWTKSAKDDYMKSMPSNECDEENLVMFRRGVMSAAFNTLCDISCEHPDDYKEVMEAIYSVRENIKRRREGNGKHNGNSSVIGDPDVVKTKGAPRKRKSWKKQRRCSHCKKPGHTKRKCPILAGRDGLHKAEEEDSSGQSDHDTNSDALSDVRYEDDDTSCGNQTKTKFTDLNQESINTRTSKRTGKEEISQSNDGSFAPNHTTNFQNNVHQTPGFVYGNPPTNLEGQNATWSYGFGYVPGYFGVPNQGVPIFPHFPPTVNLASHPNTTMYPRTSHPNTNMYSERNHFMGVLEEVERSAKMAKRE